MEYPLYTDYPVSPANLVETYIGFIGSRERSNRGIVHSPREFSLRRASHLIASACVQLDSGSETTAGEYLETALKGVGIIADNQEDSSVEAEMERVTAKQLFYLATLISDRDQLDAVRTYQKAIHKLSIENGMYASQRLDGRRADPLTASTLIGRRSQDTIGALLSRLAHPWVLAIPALPHHDRATRQDHRRSSSNHDFVIVQTGPYSNETITSKVQSKRGCAMLCQPEGQVQQQTELKKDYRGAYDDDIVIISEHCDISVPSGLSSPALMKLLICESQGQASSWQVRDLDSITSGLFLNIAADDPRRLGAVKATTSVRQFGAGTSA